MGRKFDTNYSFYRMPTTLRLRQVNSCNRHQVENKVSYVQIVLVENIGNPQAPIGTTRQSMNKGILLVVVTTLRPESFLENTTVILTCLAPHPTERMTALATSRGGSRPSPHTVKLLMFLNRNLRAGRERCSMACFRKDEHTPALSMWRNDASSHTVKARSRARHSKERSSKQPSKPVFPGAGDALEHTRVFITSIGANGRRCCRTTCSGVGRRGSRHRYHL